MYVFEYHDQIYYINTANIVLMVIGPSEPLMASAFYGRYHAYRPEPKDQWALTIKYGTARDTFWFDTKEEAQTLANNIHTFCSPAQWIVKHD